MEEAHGFECIYTLQHGIRSNGSSKKAISWVLLSDLLNLSKKKECVGKEENERVAWRPSLALITRLFTRSLACCFSASPSHFFPPPLSQSLFHSLSVVLKNSSNAVDKPNQILAQSLAIFHSLLHIFVHIESHLWPHSSFCGQLVQNKVLPFRPSFFPPP